MESSHAIKFTCGRPRCYIGTVWIIRLRDFRRALADSSVGGEESDVYKQATEIKFFLHEREEIRTSVGLW